LRWSCKAAREFFHANGIRYIDEGIEKHLALAHQKPSGSVVSFIVLGAKMVSGYNEGELQ